MTSIREPASAKLNVFLRVRARREDGYHEVESLILPLTLADGVEAAPGEGLSLTVVGPRAGGVPVEGNLMLEAARALARACGGDRGARLTLAKHVPVAAGLGGGSADAAATLRALNDLWGCGMPPERLAGIGAEVGSDVPALVLGGPVLVGGRGEVVRRVRVARTWWALLPADFGVSAADAYRWWDEDGGRPGPDPGPLLEALRTDNAEAVGRLLFNDLEAPVAARHPEVATARERLLAAGAVGALLCGSGPTVAGLARDGRHAEDLAAAVGGIAVGSAFGRPPGG